MKHAEKGAELFKQGYNCAQAVFGAFCDITELDENKAFLISSSFGGGMGGMHLACGALTGAFMAAGILFGYNDPKATKEKTKHYDLIKEIAKRFQERNSFIDCGKLLEGLAQDNLPPKSEVAETYCHDCRPCVRFVIDACDILDEIIEEKLKQEKVMV